MKLFLYILIILTSLSFKSYANNEELLMDKFLEKELEDFEISKENKNISNLTFEDHTGKKIKFANFKGKILLINFWATWCAPCIKEMPSLDRLQLKLNKNFKVLAISEDRNGIKKVKDFFAENNINNLEQYFDVKGKLAKELELIGMPTTLVVDKKGYVIGRYQGDMEWDDTEVIKFINYFIEND